MRTRPVQQRHIKHVFVPVGEEVVLTKGDINLGNGTTTLPALSFLSIAGQ